MISTLVSAGMMPSTSLAVEGWERTLTWVDVTPSAGGRVGCGGRGCGVSDEAGITAGGVDVIASDVITDVTAA